MNERGRPAAARERAAAIAALRGIETPAFVYDERALDQACRRVAHAARAAGALPLFAMKCFGALPSFRARKPSIK